MNNPKKRDVEVLAAIVRVGTDVRVVRPDMIPTRTSAPPPADPPPRGEPNKYGWYPPR